MINLKDYQVVVIKNTYDLYENCETTRRLLAETWGMKLRGYKKYFPYGVLPIDHLDFIANHIIICKYNNNQLTPVSGIKNVTFQKCLDFNIDFPIFDHLFSGRESEYANHIAAIRNWLERKSPSNVAYSMGLTIEPNLSKLEKDFLLNLNWSLFYYFYTHNVIGNIIHGISKTFKLDRYQEEIGFKYLVYNDQKLNHIRTKSYNDVESYVMILEDFNFHNAFKAKSKFYEKLWSSKLELSGKELLKQVA